ncbi:CBS domain-containing protein [Aquiflexum gelatinilyticum]|uniref:CBS domain-containing protein n=1 Tax=Aquiflexum gelatinilyticum TaxID=2961943 RepID=A0A9X2T290_9BACT|nr:CBS domain-containing protein [Aquiflexum gelatinilyticum]MCR9015215.1 CBS domain-containing protein [Aquiflexum gelatinilyticum]
MQAYEFINNLIPPLKLKDKVKLALNWMEEIRTDILPVVEDSRFLGFITEDLVFTINNPETSIAEISLDNVSCFVYQDKHIYDVIKVASEFHSNMIAVVDRENNYLGVVTMEDAISAFADSLSIQSNGAVLVLSMNMTDYSLFEIARIIESENTKILSSFLSSDPLDDSKIKLTLKLDKTELRHVKATLERFGYRILDHFQEEEGISGEQERIDNLFRFLQI